MGNREFMVRVGDLLWKGPKVDSDEAGNIVRNLYYGGKTSDDRFQLVVEFRNGYANLSFSTEQHVIQIVDQQFRVLEVNDEYIVVQYLGLEK